MTRWLFGLGVGGLVLAVLSSGFLVLDHWGGMSLPGCGEGSPCEQAAKSVLGTVPGTSWPMSHVGIAYFIGALVSWVTGRTLSPGAGFLLIIRLGAVASVVLVVSLFTQGFLCPYCMVAHAGNLIFWLVAERAAKTAFRVEGRVVTALASYVLITLLLIPLEQRSGEKARQEAMREVDESVNEVLSRPSVVTTAGFVGRHIKGPDPAALRIVIFSDYQCEVCGRVDEELKRAVGERNDVALSVKHFPLSSDCNVFARERGINMHPNACRAAIVAEAAAVLGGEDLFWVVHEELFQLGGNFTDKELDRLIVSWGHDVQRFREVMINEKTQSWIESDIKEGVELGLHYTPMVFINGVQIRGVQQSGMITRAIARVVAKNPPYLSWAVAGDQPATAEEKLLEDWKDSQAVTLPADEFRWPMGVPESQPANLVVVWGDYQEKNTRSVDDILRKRIEAKGDIRYTFRHFPFDSACNPHTSRTRHPQACLAARAVEAAGVLGGVDGWRKMHRWLWPNHHRFSEEIFGKVARGLQFDPDRYLATFSHPEVEAALQEDIGGGYELNIKAIPTIYINGRRLPRWTLNQKPYLDELLDAIGEDE